MHPVAGLQIPVMALSVSSVSVDQALNENRSHIKAWLPGVDWNPSPNTMRAPVIMLPRHVRPTPWGRCGHSTMIIAIDSVVILPTVSILISSVSTSLMPRGRSYVVSRLNCVCNHGSAMDPIPRVRYGCILFSRRPEQSSDLHQTSASFRLGKLN